MTIPPEAIHLADAVRIAELEHQLEHAKAALAGDHEGIRLWMLDCAALTDKHRKRADEAAAAERDRIRQRIKDAAMDREWCADLHAGGARQTAALGYIFEAPHGTDLLRAEP